MYLIVKSINIHTQIYTFILVEQIIILKNNLEKFGKEKRKICSNENTFSVVEKAEKGFGDVIKNFFKLSKPGALCLHEKLVWIRLER